LVGELARGALTVTAFGGGVLAADSRKKNLQETFASPEAAGKALVSAAGAHDGNRLLGKKTEAVVKAMTTFEPDKTWRKVEGKHLEPSVSSRRGGKSLNAFLRRLPVLRLSSQQIKPRGTGGESRSPRGLVTPVQ